ncbi:MAG TPA: hypothetical protein PLV92_08495, partial [Pirellulaceae bacterium]|nr:hypothetical protein [Pirellulaceae bacterium]
MSRRRKWALVAAVLAGSGFAFGDAGGPVAGRAAETKDGKVYTQAVEVLSATNRAADGSLVPADSPASERPVAPKSKVKAPTAPPPTTYWIWGADQNKKYVLRKQFEGRAKVARLKAACDNIMSVSVNGQAVASGSSWQDPVTVDVASKLTDGLNTIAVEVTNQGGPAGFTLRLALTGDDGKIRYVVTDDSWEAADAKSPDKFVPVKRVAKIGDEPWGDVYSGAAGQGTTSNLFNLLPGFQVERIFTVPKDELGSWVAITTDDRGRLIASDQGDKGLFRITPPKAGSGEPTKVERLNVRLSSAQGLLHAFGALYVSVNGGPGSGLYRVKDTDGDDQYDELVKLKDFRGGGEHGPHALTLSPDGQSIFVSCGNHTLPPFDPKDPPKAEHTSRIPTNWDEDHLLPRQWDANGHARGILAPGGWLAKTDPEGKTWEVFSIGYRNQYDLAFNADGELFSYDADMEWDMGSPWYRPTRVVHA